MHMVYKAGTVGKWTLNFFKLICLVPILILSIMALLSLSNASDLCWSWPIDSLDTLLGTGQMCLLPLGDEPKYREC